MKQISKQIYIKVDQKDQKTPIGGLEIDTAEDTALKTEEALKVIKTALMGKGGKRKLNNLTTRIWVSGDSASSSGTVYNTVINVRPSATAEFTSLASLYDEFKVHSGVVHFGIWATGQTNAVVDVDGAVVYDPMDNTAYTALITALPASQKFGPFSITGMTDSSVAGSTARTVAPLPTSRTGLYRFQFKCPNGPSSTTGNSQQVVTGQWCSTNIANTQGDYGYIKPIISAAGSTVTDFRYYMEMVVEFRSRT